MTEKKLPLLFPLWLMWRKVTSFPRGERTLVAAFWGLGVLGFLATLVALVVAISHYKLSGWLSLLGLFYFIYMIKSIWACSGNVKNQMWGDLIKTIIVFFLGLFIFFTALRILRGQ